MEGMREEYGAWMVVTKCKPPSKARVKPPIQEGSDSAELVQRIDATLSPRAMNQDKKEGKRKVNYQQPMVPFRETKKTATSNCEILGTGRSFGDSGHRGKSNQKAKGLGSNQREGVGPSKSSGLFTFGDGPRFLNKNGPFFAFPAQLAHALTLMLRKRDHRTLL